jgi:hypothetical protein
MNRRGFLQAILAAGVAPAVITTPGILMPVKQLWIPSSDLTAIQPSVMLTGNFTKVLWPGVITFWGPVYYSEIQGEGPANPWINPRRQVS